MAKVGSITYNSEISEFLKESEVSEVVDSLGKEGLSEVEGEFSTKLKAEMETGLSLESLNLDGRAPLNEVSTEILARLNVTMEDIDILKKIAQAEGNKHRKDEATAYWKAVKDRYKELCSDFKSAADTYNNNLRHKTGEDADGNPEYGNYNKCTYVIPSDYTTVVELTSKPDSDSSYAGKVNDTFKAAKDFYNNKVEEAYKYYKECKGLDTAMSKYRVPVGDNEKLPDGVQPGAKKVEISDAHTSTVTYTNPDGSTVEISKVDGKTTKHRVKNRYGYITESIIYDKDGNIDHKNVYTYKKVKGKNHVYQVQQDVYDYDKDSNKYSEKPSKTNENYSYAYPGKNDGKIEYKTKEPEQSDVGTPKSTKYVSEDSTDTSKTNGDSQSTKTSTTAEKVTSASLRETLEEKKDFILPKGSTITEDRKGVYNQTYTVNEDTYFEYDSKDNVYYAKNGDGKYVDALGVVRTKEWLKEKKDYLDADNYLKGTGQAPVNDPEFSTSNNSRATIKND